MFLATVFTILITLLNIAVYYLRKHHEEGYDKRSHKLCRRFSLAEIKSATHNFDESLVVGKGGFGKVYKGTIDKGACTVAIKRLDLGSKQGAPEFWTEIEMLSRFKHSHLVSLIGYCDDYQEMIIVYEYMPTGALRDHLHKIGGSHNRTFSLSWVQRLKICIGAARGLDYLHTGTSIRERIIHRDVKSSNILLDQNWAAKISDFGLSKVGPANQDCTAVSTHVKGTFGYMDPEYYLTRRVTRKSDVYALGVVLLEVLCGRPALDFELEEEQHSLARWGKKCIKEGKLDEIIDPCLRGQILATCLKEFGQLANQCLHNQPKKRPTMAEVVVKLEFVLSLQEITDVSVLGEQIIDDGAYDYNQDTVEYSPEHVVNNGADGGEHQKEQNDRDAGSGGASGIKSQTLSAHRARFRRKVHFNNAAYNDEPQTKPAKRMAFFKMVRFMFSPKSAEEKMYSHHLHVKRFSLRELQIATHNFSENNILGEGGFGKVYKGRLDNGSVVAVKRHRKNAQQGMKEFLTEINFNALAQHRNLLQLLGFCSTATERILVYPYMPNGSVASQLRGRPITRPALDWQTRKRIALGSARAIAYLHDDCVPRTILRDVKTSNFLLDEGFEVVIGDFGLVKTMDTSDTHVTTRVVGTIGYMAPDYAITGRCSQKTDVFGYGIVLLELITGQSHHVRLANVEDILTLNWVKREMKENMLETLVDAELQGNYIDEEVEQLMQVALLCTQGSPEERPRMSEVVRMLQGDGLVEKWEECQKEELFRLQEYSFPSYTTNSSAERSTATVDNIHSEDYRKEELFRMQEYSFPYTNNSSAEWSTAAVDDFF